MAHRERAYLGDKIVTVISADGNGKNANVEVRDAFGYVSTVKAHQLKRMDASDPNAAFEYASPD